MKKPFTDLSWKNPSPEVFHLPPGQVHVWRALLEENEKPLEHFLSLLSTEEQSRAEKFHFDKDRKYFISTRGILRLLLGQYLNNDPKALQISTDSHGKPSLIKHNNDPISFNVSHSGGVALFAFRRGGEVGVDVEEMKEDRGIQGIAKRYFSPQESETIFQLSPILQREYFYSNWTCKEAFLKAIGEGLRVPLDQVEISWESSSRAKILNPHKIEFSLWSLIKLPAPQQGFAAAVAALGEDWELNCYSFS